MEKYRIISEKIYGDGVSNTVYIKRIYAVPWYMNKVRAVDYFSRTGKYAITKDGVFKDHQFLGWFDDKCRTIGMLITVTPNNGKIIYNE